jgi:hypothetical protein
VDHVNTASVTDGNVGRLRISGAEGGVVSTTKERRASALSRPAAVNWVSRNV